ncbi:type II secretion system protein [bacterium]|nr:type II secretion system protein [bacterium]
MKKFGFTLAEVLITLSIIGVVSAITLPTLTSNTRTAQIGPKLAKAASMFEQANQALLNERGVDSLFDTNLLPADQGGDFDDYLDELRNFMKITILDDENNNPFPNRASWTEGGSTPNNDCRVGNPHEMAGYFATKDGIVYGLRMAVFAPLNRRPHRSYVGGVMVDINGTARPNETGRDIFAFALYADGSLRPVGSDDWNEANPNSQCSWRTQCEPNVPMLDGYACTGHIFANDLKVLYN